MTLRKDPSGNLLCSECDSPITDKWSLAGLISVVSTMDIFAWVLAGLFAILGLVWPPGYLVAGLTVAFGLFKALARRQRYVCSKCKRAFPQEEVQGN
jgi:hypothetical protein